MGPLESSHLTWPHVGPVSTQTRPLGSSAASLLQREMHRLGLWARARCLPALGATLWLPRALEGPHTV